MSATFNHSARNGFALVDSMVALAIFAVMSALLFQTVSSTVIAKRHLADSRQAILLAQSRLAELQDADSANTLQDSGRDGNFLWRTKVERQAETANDNGQGLETISVAVSNASTGRIVVRLKSLRLAR